MAQSDFLYDVLVRQQTQLEGLKEKYIEEFDDILGDINKTINEILLKYQVEKISDLNDNQLLVLIETVRDEIWQFLETFSETFKKQLEEIANHEAEFLLAAIVLAIVDTERLRTPDSGAAWEFALTNPVQATGQLLEDYLASWRNGSVGAFESLIRNAAAQGWTFPQTVAAIRGTRAANYTDGLLGKLFRNSMFMIRTSVQHVSNTARASVYEANSDGRLLQGYRWVSVLDNRTTQICRSLDGRVFIVGEGPLPPIHILCRSTTIPEFADSVKLLENATRPSMFGPVRANLTYYQWLSLQPAWFQDRVLGPTRGKLFREGGLTADEFARLNLGRTFEPLTLEEMRRRWPEIFEQAGL